MTRDSIPLQAWTQTSSSRTRHKVTRFSAIFTGRLYSPGDNPSTVSDRG